MKMMQCFKYFAFTLLISLFALNASASTYVDDASITTSIVTKLTAAKNLPATDIKVSTHKGTVQLSGFVDTKGQVRRAEQIAKKVDGVGKVVNNLLVKTKPENAATQYAKDTAITTKVKAKLATREGVSATQIGVNTYNGVVQLSGFVDSQAAINKASTLTKNVEGVMKVHNNLLLKDQEDMSE